MNDDRPDRAATVGSAHIHSDAGVSISFTDNHGLAGRFILELSACWMWNDLTGSEVKLAIALCSLINAKFVTKQGEPIVRRSQSELMSDSSLGEVSVRRGADRLIELGIITEFAKGIGKRRTVYILHFVAANPRSKVESTEPEFAQMMAAMCDQTPLESTPDSERISEGSFFVPLNDPTDARHRSAPQRGLNARHCGAHLDTSDTEHYPSSGQNPAGHTIPINAMHKCNAFEELDAGLSEDGGKDSSNDESEQVVHLLVEQGFDYPAAVKLSRHHNATLERVKAMIGRAVEFEATGQPWKKSKNAFITRGIYEKFMPPLRPEERAQIEKERYVRYERPIEQAREAKIERSEAARRLQSLKQTLWGMSSVDRRKTLYFDALATLPGDDDRRELYQRDVQRGMDDPDMIQAMLNLHQGKSAWDFADEFPQTAEAGDAENS